MIAVDAGRPLSLEEFAAAGPEWRGLPAKVQFLFEHHRYKGARGGRGSAKSESFARALLLLGTGQIPGWEKPLRILCARETQKSIGESVHQLLRDLIEELDLAGFYDVRKSWIRGANGTLFTFAGLKNVRNLKSLANYDIVWVEEAEGVSGDSWAKLIPTLRKDGSEIWFTFNPNLKTDATYQRFVVSPPASAVVVEMNWRDNPWFPEVLRKEMEELRQRDPDECDHVYEGQCLSMVKGAIYANEFRAVDRENRITRVPYDATHPVDTWWDLGWADYVSIWCTQSFPFEYRVIDFLEGNRQGLKDYLKLLQQRPYIYRVHHLPHDGAARTFAANGKSVEQLMREAGCKVKVLPNLQVFVGIDAVRAVFPRCYFDAERCEDGIEHLRHYKYGAIKTLGVDSREPLHDEHSHAADAFRQFAIGVRAPDPPKREEQRRRPSRISVWS